MSASVTINLNEYNSQEGVNPLLRSSIFDALAPSKGQFLNHERSTAPHPFRVETLDYFPWVSTISGIARVVFGTVQTGVGLVLFPIQLCGRIVNYKTSFILGHGIANIIRGFVAMVPVFGNISLYVYDHTRFV